MAMADEPEDVDVRAATPLARLVAWLGPPRDYRLTRWVILRLLGVVYLFAFIGLLHQAAPLLGEHGLTPIDRFLERTAASGRTFWDVPTVFALSASDAAILTWAGIGCALAVAVVIGYANLPILLVLWVIYGSFVRAGQLWFSFGWEIQILETTLVAAILAHPWDPRPLRAPSPSVAAIVLMRWLAFRVMLGAGLIKLRGSGCWSDLTCLHWHFETQPIPNPVSPLVHHLPHAVLATGVALNHLVELVLPWFSFGPRVLRIIAGLGMAGFQIILILTGNLAFLNWLTLVPILACLDDDVLLRALPRRARSWVVRQLGPRAPARDRKPFWIGLAAGTAVIVCWMPVLGPRAAPTQVGLALVLGAIAVGSAVRWRVQLASPGRTLDGYQLAVGLFTALVALKSLDVIANLASSNQAMNRSYDRLALVNTYGAFGSVNAERHELVIEGTGDPDPRAATWHAYELPCKPGALARRPCILGPYHRRLDWLIWFAAMSERPGDAWIVHLVWKLLDGDRGIRGLLAHDPFAGAPPTWIRIRRFVYRLAPYQAETWWTRDREQLWLPPVARDSPALIEALRRRGGPSPTLR